MLTLTIPGYTISYKTWGNPDFPPMIALHGWLDNANSFDLLAPYLAKQFYVIALDFPGHGLSSHLPQGCYYHFMDGIFTFINIINALQLDKVHLLGHSMGACLASLIAGVIPEKILSLLLIEAIGPFSSPAQTCRKQLAYFASHDLIKNHSIVKSYPSLELAAQARAKTGHLSLEHAQILCERGVEEQEGQFFWRHDRRLLTATPLQMTEEQILSCLEAIQTKTCLIRATNGFLFDENIVQKRINAVKQLIVYSLDGGHHVHMEKPDAVTQRLVEFYND